MKGSTGTDAGGPARQQGQLTDELVRAVPAAEQSLGRRVLAHRAEVIPEAGIRVEIFEPADPSELSSGLQPLRLERG